MRWQERSGRNALVFWWGSCPIKSHQCGHWAISRTKKWQLAIVSVLSNYFIAHELGFRNYKVSGIAPGFS
jgi:hypothetical protein